MSERVGKNYEIVGVIRSQTEALNAMIGTNIGAFVYVPYTAVNESADESGIDQIAIRCKDDVEPSATARAAETYMSRTSPTDGRYVAENITGYLERVKGIVRLIKLLVTAIGGISLIVAGVGVMNGMLAGIEERRREIGIYLAVGAIPRDIIENVLLEAVFICVLGGCAGCMLGVFELPRSVTLSRCHVWWARQTCSLPLGFPAFAASYLALCRQ